MEEDAADVGYKPCHRRSDGMRASSSFRLLGETRGNAFHQLKLMAFSLKASREL